MAVKKMGYCEQSQLILSATHVLKQPAGWTVRSLQHSMPDRRNPHSGKTGVSVDRETEYIMKHKDFP